ncbi:hypothetical protein [Kitasatospora sp. NPDC092286]|uniref:hypothetical protein n=1 Tax=Kitasatospora sp. NPDC092286 TaxID=3364087 RepID=UPI003805E3E8
MTHSRRRAVLPVLAVALALPLAGCASDPKPSATAATSGPVATGAASGAGTPAAVPSAPVAPADGGGATKDGKGGATADGKPVPSAPATDGLQPPSWRSAAITSVKDTDLLQRFKDHWGLDFITQQIKGVPGTLPDHVCYQALKKLPDGHTLAIEIRADHEGNPRMILAVSRGQADDASATELTETLDIVLKGQATEDQKSWVNAQFASQRPGAGPAQPAVPRLIAGGLNAGLSITAEYASLEIFSDAPRP